ncbi:hypothetical protein P3X46_034115, partial [Hevea brasiliensis]
ICSASSSRACSASTGHVPTNGRLLQTNGRGNASTTTTTSSTAEITLGKAKKVWGSGFLWQERR